MFRFLILSKLCLVPANFKAAGPRGLLSPQSCIPSAWGPGWQEDWGRGASQRLLLLLEIPLGTQGAQGKELPYELIICTAQTFRTCPEA